MVKKLDMDIALYTLTSPLHDENAVNAVSGDFVKGIEEALGFSMDFRGPDFEGYGSHDLDIVYVRTGGTEGLFLEILPLLKGRVVLLTSGKSNSLAASMEIMSYLNNIGRTGEILHGSDIYIAERIALLAKVNVARKSLAGKRLGVIGKPSDWLISSNSDRKAVKEKLGIEIVDVPIDELVAEITSVTSSESISGLEETVCKELKSNATDPVRRFVDGAFDIYHALKKIISRYGLSGMTLRCFDLLSAVGNTGCLALALLNSEGIPAGCEGDVPALVTMAVGHALTGQCGFQANPSRIDPESGEMLLAHCTVPFDMVRKYTFNTHFESGIGIAVHGEMPEGEAVIFKLSGDLSRSFSCGAELVENRYEKDLCRTQIIMSLKASDEDKKRICRDYFLKSPIGNHHIVFTGTRKHLFDAFFDSLI